MYWLNRSLVISILLGIGTLGFWAFYKRRQKKQIQQLQRAEDELRPILKDYTRFRSYTTKYATYPNIRTFYRPHSHKEKHVGLGDLPLLVFIHGLGGVLPQFAGILGSLTNIAPCFGLELPGHGRSSFAPKDFQAYTIEANATLWKAAIEDVCTANGHKEVVLIGHSMGCSLAALLASATSTASRLSVSVVGMIAICPRARQFSLHEVQAARRLFTLPDFVINILRWVDRKGGENSTSVSRVLGVSNESDLKRIQLAWNRQFQTPVLKRETLGLLPTIASDGSLIGGYPSEAVWKSIKTPVFLIAGGSDKICKPEEIDNVVQYITGHNLSKAGTSDTTADADQSSANRMIPKTIQTANSFIQTIVFPKPAAHALLYAHATYRLVSALIESFLLEHVSPKLDFTYQLQLLTGSGKWDVKNLDKWRKVLPVSGPIHTVDNPNGLFRALKTMREQDDEHNPVKFLENWQDKIYAVVDISHDAPVYDTKVLEKGGVEYHKFPTVSKIPPTPSEVQDFCNLVDKLLADQAKKEDRRAIAVHCHYGYNRTGFFIVSYLILRKEYSIQQAIDEFKKAKPPGIKHEHFLDTLWLRYCHIRTRGGRRDKEDGLENKNNGGLIVPSSSVDDAGYLTEGDLM